MAQYQHLPIYKKTYDILLRTMTATKDFPREYKYTLGQKIKKAKTDVEPLPETSEGLEGRPEAENLVTIYSVLSGIAIEDVLYEYAGRGFGDFKPALADLMVDKMAPITDHMKYLLSDKAEIDAIIEKGRDRVAPVAEKTLRETKEILGFLPPVEGGK